MARTLALTVATMLLLPATAALGACLDEVADHEARLAEAKEAGAAETTVDVETTEGSAQVEANESTSEAPDGSWFTATGDSLEGAEQILEQARSAAENGNEAGCQDQLAQARRILEAAR